MIEIQGSDEIIAALQDELDQKAFEAAKRIDPSYAAKVAKAERLQIEVSGLRGQLRRAKRNAAPTLEASRKGFATKVFGPTNPSTGAETAARCV